MRRKRLPVLAGVALAAAVLVPAALELHAYRHRLARSRLITWEHYRGVKLGMSQAEVEAVLGGPPGDFCTESVSYWDDSEAGLSPQGVARWGSWCGNDGLISLGFDKEGRVLRRGFTSAVWSPPPTLAERLRTWLRRVWP